MGRTQEPGWIVSLAEDSQMKDWGQLKTPKSEFKRGDVQEDGLNR
jgi:hypothetical protein